VGERRRRGDESQDKSMVDQVTTRSMIAHNAIVLQKRQKRQKRWWMTVERNKSEE
jgi:hypothetical protein